MKLKTILVGAALFCTAPVFGATSGSCIGAAQGLSLSASESTTPVKLTAEYDPEYEEYDPDTGVYYYKVSIGKGKTCSVLIDNLYNEFMGLSVDYDWEEYDGDDDVYPDVYFDTFYRDDATLCVLSAENWGDEDPSSVTFYICISGDVGDTCTLHYTSQWMDGDAWEDGGKPDPDPGTPENPVKITPKESGETYASANLIDGKYYYTFTAAANRAYRFHTIGGKDGKPLNVRTVTAAKGDEVKDRTTVVDEFNDAIELRMSEAGAVTVIVSGRTGYSDTYAFQLYGQLVPRRAIGDHPVTVLEDNDYRATFVPGRLSAESNVWDHIIDEHLFRIDLTNAERCVFEVCGSQTNLLMRIYDSTEKVLKENTDLNPYVAYTAPAKGTYYIGVCQKDLEVTETTDAGEVTLLAKRVPEPTDGDPDEWDAADDTAAGATEVEATISNDSTDPLLAQGQGPHELSLSDWADCFKVECQKGVTYKFAATNETPSAYSLNGQVFTVSSKGAESSVKSGSLTKGGVEFTASASQTYYLRVTVREGQGRDYPGYTLHTIAYVSGQKLGRLTVNIKGAPSATWTYKNPSYEDKTPRKGGDQVLTWGSNAITFSSVKGYTTPGKITYVMTGDEEEDVVTGVYNDTSDPGDDYPSGTIPGTTKKYAPVKVTPSAKGASVERSLHDEDPADWFQFTATAGNYYRFELSGKDGDAIVRVYGPGNWTNEVKNVLNDDTNNVWHVLAETKGTYYVCVTHGDPEAKETDGSYRMTATSANVGAIKFAKTAVSVKETAAYADLTVNRTAKDGMVRVKFTTEDGTAVDHNDYYATNGVICWANGDNKAKTIRVRLLPELYQTWRPNRQFKVRLSTYAEDEIDKTQEYIPALQTPEAVVTITETAKKAPGTVSVTACTNDAAQTEAEITVKSPSVTVSDDCGSLTFALARSAGADGRVAVKVETVKGTAKAGEEFEPVSETLYWEAGDVASKSVTVKINPIEDPSIVTKNFKLKLSAVKKDTFGTYESAKIGTSAITVNLRNNLVEETAEELAKTIGKSEGLVLKAAKAGTWYVDSKDGALKTVPLADKKKAELTFTLTGPGLFKAKASKYCGTFTCKIGKEADIVIDEGTDIVRLVPAGSTTVKFSMTGESSMCGPSVGSLEAEFDGQPYFWMPLTGVAAELPKDKATVLPAAERQAFGWTVPAKAAESGIYYRLTLAEKAKDLGTGAAKILTTALTESEFAYVGALDANKTYCWRVDYSLDSENWVAPKTSWTFKTAAGTEGIPMPAVAEGATDSYGRDIVAGKTIGLMQGVKVNFALTASNTEAAVTYSLANGKLPDGVKLVADKKSGVTSITGVPTKAGEFNVLVQAKAGKTVGTTEAFSFHVKPLALCAGTFNGVLKHDSESAGVVGMGELSSVAFTASEKGALSAKVQIAGKSYTFKATGYDRVEKEEDFGDETLSVALEQIQKIGKASYTNTLDLTVCYDELDEEGKALLGSAAEATLKMSALSADKAYAGERIWNGGLYRDNTKFAAMVADEADFVGYYTMALCPPEGTDSRVAPAGNGYLTLTVDNKGKVKVAGKLADGTALSGSVVAALSRIGAGVCDPGQAALLVPYYFAKSTSLFGGTIVLKQTADGIVVDSGSSKMTWNNDAGTATYGGMEGYKLQVFTVGGYYDTLVNLQRYYLDYGFWFDVSDDLPSELFAAGYGLAEYGLPGEGKPLEMLLAGNTPTVDKCALTKIGKTKLYDLGASVNPWNVKLTFKRATGVLSGSLSVWSETADGSAQKEIKSLKHEGVLLLSREGGEPMLDNRVWTAGYYLVPTTLPKVGAKGTRKWTCSLPFNILTAAPEAN